MRDVFFACPQQLDKFVDGFGNLRGLHNEVQFQATTEATTQERGLQSDVFRLGAQSSSHCTLRALLELCGSNQQDFVALHVSREVHRLQRSM